MSAPLPRAPGCPGYRVLEGPQRLRACCGCGAEVHGHGWRQHAARCAGRQLPPATDSARVATERVKQEPKAGDRLVELRALVVEVLSVANGRVRWRETQGADSREVEGDLAEWFRAHAWTPGRPGWWVSA